jgi:hypothetical protein
MRCAGDSSVSVAVDIFDANSGRWSTAALSVARYDLAATSLPNQGLAIFAGGRGLMSDACDGCCCVLCVVMDVWGKNCV